jgi:hypothetical protein
MPAVPTVNPVFAEDEVEGAAEAFDRDLVHAHCVTNKATTNSCKGW